jgi:orotate phosphoribosyltransferase
MKFLTRKTQTWEECRSSYLATVLLPDLRKIVIAELVKRLKSFGLGKFDTIAFRGMSGALIVPVIADKLQKAMIFVRKGETNHSDYQVEGNKKVSKYIIIDDLIFSGGTIHSILDKVNDCMNDEGGRTIKCVGIFLYRDYSTKQEFVCPKTKEAIPVNAFTVNGETKRIQS